MSDSSQSLELSSSDSHLTSTSTTLTSTTLTSTNSTLSIALILSHSPSRNRLALHLLASPHHSHALATLLLLLDLLAILRSNASQSAFDLPTTTTRRPTTSPSSTTSRPKHRPQSSLINHLQQDPALHHLQSLYAPSFPSPLSLNPHGPSKPHLVSFLSPPHSSLHTSPPPIPQLQSLGQIACDELGAMHPCQSWFIRERPSLMPLLFPLHSNNCTSFKDLLALWPSTTFPTPATSQLYAFSLRSSTPSLHRLAILGLLDLHVGPLSRLQKHALDLFYIPLEKQDIGSPSTPFSPHPSLITESDPASLPTPQLMLLRSLKLRHFFGPELSLSPLATPLQPSGDHPLVHSNHDDGPPSHHHHRRYRTGWNLSSVFAPNPRRKSIALEDMREDDRPRKRSSMAYTDLLQPSCHPTTHTYFSRVGTDPTLTPTFPTSGFAPGPIPILASETSDDDSTSTITPPPFGSMKRHRLTKAERTLGEELGEGIVGVKVVTRVETQDSLSFASAVPPPSTRMAYSSSVGAVPSHKPLSPRQRLGQANNGSLESLSHPISRKHPGHKLTATSSLLLTKLLGESSSPSPSSTTPHHHSHPSLSNKKPLWFSQSPLASKILMGKPPPSFEYQHTHRHLHSRGSSSLSSTPKLRKSFSSTHSGSRPTTYHPTASQLVQDHTHHLDLNPTHHQPSPPCVVQCIRSARKLEKMLGVRPDSISYCSSTAMSCSIHRKDTHMDLTDQLAAETTRSRQIKGGPLTCTHAGSSTGLV